MKRYEACVFLTSVASDEMISKTVSDVFYKARDIVVCEKNKILDVLATDEHRRQFRNILDNYLLAMTHDEFIADDIKDKAHELWQDLQCEYHSQDGFYEKCDEMYLPTRCRDCPNYKGREK